MSIVGRRHIEPTPVCIPIGKVISMTVPSRYQEPRRVGGGEIGSENKEFQGIRHVLSNRDRRDAQSLWIVRNERNGHFNYWMYNNILNEIRGKSKSWKKKIQQGNIILSMEYNISVNGLL